MIKEPKTFKWPRLYWQPFKKGLYQNETGRMRIIYPDGTAEYLPEAALEEGSSVSWMIPCWNMTEYLDMRNIKGTPKQALGRMRQYDKEIRYCDKAIFIGEIK